MEDFEEFAVPYLREHLPPQSVPATDDELRAQLRSATERSRAYGFETEEQILDFTTAQCLLGENFESDPENPWVEDVLHDEEASLDERAAILAAVASLIAEERGGA